MRIAPRVKPNGVERRQSVGARQGTGNAAFAPAAAGASMSPPAVGVAGTAPLASLGSIIAAQEVESAAERRMRARRRGEDALDVLEDLRVATAAGNSPERARADLERLVATERDSSGDRDLDRVLDEIDLRAAVELAKLDRTG